MGARLRVEIKCDQWLKVEPFVCQTKIDTFATMNHGCLDIEMPTGWYESMFDWYDTGEKELRYYCPIHAEKRRGG